MEYIINSVEVKKKMVEKQALEVYLAFDLLEIFNDPGTALIGPLRDMVSLAITSMDEVYKKHYILFMDKWVGNWNQYAGVKENFIVMWNYDHIQAQVRHFKAEHCADWIRIYGEVVEDILSKFPGNIEDMIRKAGQKGDPYHWKKFDARPKAVKEDPNQFHKGRRRIMAKFNPSHVQYVSSKTPAWDFLQQQPSSGMHRWDVKERDTIGKMDQVFGLTPGATISGTTTDNIYFIDKFGRLRINPIFYLLPAATLVSGGHHTLLEVAFPLSLNGLIDYKVGLYSTLYPTGAGSSRLPGAAGAREIKSLLQLYENRQENHLMLVWYNGPRTPYGCVMYSKTTEKMTWQSFTRADNKLMAFFKRMTPWPSIYGINALQPDVSFFRGAIGE